MVTELRAKGVPQERAEHAAREALGLTPAVVQAAEQKDARVREKEEQAVCRAVFLAYGFKVYNLSQARASKQSPGLGDLWVVHRTKPIAFWYESKRQVGGELSPAQVDFRDECWRCGVNYGSGDRFAATAFVNELLARTAGL